MSVCDVMYVFTVTSQAKGLPLDQVEDRIRATTIAVLLSRPFYVSRPRLVLRDRDRNLDKMNSSLETTVSRSQHCIIARQFLPATTGQHLHRCDYSHDFAFSFRGEISHDLRTTKILSISDVTRLKPPIFTTFVPRQFAA